MEKKNRLEWYKVAINPDGRIFGGPGAECRIPQQSQRSCRAGFCGVKRKNIPRNVCFLQVRVSNVYCVLLAEMV